MKTTAFFALIGAASALVARIPPLAGGTFEPPNTLIQYQRWCPVCDTVEINEKCIRKDASCQASKLIVPDTALECAQQCSDTCQLIKPADSDYGYNCTATRPVAPPA